jgi:hypothetical protein
MKEEVKNKVLDIMTEWGELRVWHGWRSLISKVYIDTGYMATKSELLTLFRELKKNRIVDLYPVFDGDGKFSGSAYFIKDNK